MRKILAFIVPLILAAGTARAQDIGADTANANRFTLALAQAVIAHQTDPADNVVVSPYNALTALSLAATGAGGATRDEFAKALYGADGDKLADDVQSFASLNQTILDANKGHAVLHPGDTGQAHELPCFLGRAFDVEFEFHNSS